MGSLDKEEPTLKPLSIHEMLERSQASLEGNSLKESKSFISEESQRLAKEQASKAEKKEIEENAARNRRLLKAFLGIDLKDLRGKDVEEALLTLVDFKKEIKDLVAAGVAEGVAHVLGLKK